MADTRPGTEDGRHGSAVPGGAAAESHEARYMRDRAGDFFEPAIGLARLALRDGNVARAVEVLDDYCDRATEAHRAACLADGFDPELVTRFLGEPRGTTPPALQREAPEPAAGRMADRPGEAAAAMRENRLRWIESVLAERDRLTARLSEAEQQIGALNHEAEQRGEILTRAEARLSDYEQALQLLVNARDFDAIAEATKLARAALGLDTDG